MLNVNMPSKYVVVDTKIIDDAKISSRDRGGWKMWNDDNDDDGDEGINSSSSNSHDPESKAVT